MRPPPKPGRVRCINPRCNRTYKAEAHAEVVCSKCMKLCPIETKRYRALRRRRNHLRRYPHKWTPEKRDQLYRVFDRNWETLKRKLAAPGGPPANLDAFLKEMGMKDKAI